MPRTLRQTAIAAGGVASFTSPTFEQVIVARVESPEGVAARASQVNVVGSSTTQQHPITQQGDDVRVAFEVGLLGATVNVLGNANGAEYAVTWQWND